MPPVDFSRTPSGRTWSRFGQVRIEQSGIVGTRLWAVQVLFLIRIADEHTPDLAIWQRREIIRFRVRAAGSIHTLTKSGCTLKSETIGI